MTPGRRSNLGEVASFDRDQFPGGGTASAVGEQENEVLNSDGESQQFTLVWPLSSLRLTQKLLSGSSLNM